MPDATNAEDGATAINADADTFKPERLDIIAKMDKRAFENQERRRSERRKSYAEAVRAASDKNTQEVVGDLKAAGLLPADASVGGVYVWEDGQDPDFSERYQPDIVIANVEDDIGNRMNIQLTPEFGIRSASIARDIRIKRDGRTEFVGFFLSKDSLDGNTDALSFEMGLNVDGHVSKLTLVNSGSPLYTFGFAQDGSIASIRSVTFGPDGTLPASAAKDQSLQPTDEAALLELDDVAKILGFDPRSASVDKTATGAAMINYKIDDLADASLVDLMPIIGKPKPAPSSTASPVPMAVPA